MRVLLINTSERIGGAAIAAGWGLHYQWGRKDPFPLDNNLIAGGDGPVSLETAIQNPRIFYTKGAGTNWLSQSNINLWGGVSGKKTIYDPCPAGFKVPSGEGTLSPWAGLPVRSAPGGMTWSTSLWPAAAFRASSEQVNNPGGGGILECVDER